MGSVSNWAEHFTHEDLAVLCDFQSKRIDVLIHDAMFFEEEIRGIIDAARRAFPLRHTDNGAGLRQLIHAIRQTKERCEARALAAQLKRSQESMLEIERFRDHVTADNERNSATIKQRLGGSNVKSLP